MAVRPYALRASRFTGKVLIDPYLTVSEEQVAMVSWTVDTSIDSLTPPAFRGGLILFFCTAFFFSTASQAPLHSRTLRINQRTHLSWLQG